MTFFANQFRDPNDGATPPVTQIQFYFNAAGDGGLWTVPNGGSGVFTVDVFSPAGPFAAHLTVTSTTLPSYRFLLHYDRDGLTGLTKQIGRLDGTNLSSPSDTNRLYDGTWIYLAGP